MNDVSRAVIEFVIELGYECHLDEFYTTALCRVWRVTEAVYPHVLVMMEFGENVYIYGMLYRWDVRVSWRASRDYRLDLGDESFFDDLTKVLKIEFAELDKDRQRESSN